MPKVTKNIVDKHLRDRIFVGLIANDEEIIENLHRINDRQYGVILTDLNGEKRYCRIPVIVAELREDMTAEELMQSEIDAYNAKQEEKVEKAKAKAEKAAKDKARREKEKKENV